MTCAHPARPVGRFRLCLGACWGFAFWALASPAAAQYQVELSFDDGVEGTAGPCNNMETDAPVRAELIAPARRSALGVGRYGRAAEFTGGAGSLEMTGWQPADEFIAHLWVKSRSESGVLLRQEDTWALRLNQHQLALVVTREGGAGPVTLPTGLSWPADEAFHHVTLRIESFRETPTFSLSLDFGPAIEVTAPAPLRMASTTLRVGLNWEGLVDELIIANRASATLSPDDDRFNRDPNHCPADTVCREESLTVLPRGFPHEVPVRFKTVYDPGSCSTAQGCPLLFDISGGGACANDYATLENVKALTDRGFLVVTVDPYCEGNGNTSVPDSEVDQYLQVKDHVQTLGIAAPLLVDERYFAAGCSHGAEAVLAWALNEEDHPARTFARSAGGSGICGRLAGKICGAPTTPPAQVESAVAQAQHERGDFVMRITPELVSSRQIARSWGVNLEGPVCSAQGRPLCNEEGKWAMTYASLRFRSRWQQVEDPNAPTGYFVEDRSEDCQHCARADSRAFHCGACFLQYGRGAMESACPSCLDYADETIAAGAEAETCPLEASWYTDPLAVAPSPPDSGPAGEDAGPDPQDDGPSPTDPPPGAEESGPNQDEEAGPERENSDPPPSSPGWSCGQGRPAGAMAWLLVGALGWRRWRKGRRSSSRPSS